MKLIDLTLPVPAQENQQETVQFKENDRSQGGVKYTSRVYQYRHGSMAGTYIDFPGHIKETDDGLHAENYPVTRLFRLPCTVIHLDRKTGSGRIDADELQAACPDHAPAGGLILNALGDRRFDEIEWRSVYLGRSALAWIISRKIHLIISDVYESDADPQAVFPTLFGAGVSTICCPLHLHLLKTPTVRVTALTPRFPGATQLPCRVVAEMET